MSDTATSAGARAAASGLFRRLAARRRRDEALDNPRSPSGPPPPSRRTGRRLESLLYAEQVRRWLVASMAGNAVVLVVLCVAVAATYFRPVYTFAGRPSLTEATRAFYAGQDLDKDQLYMFVNYALVTLNQVNHAGAPYMALLQGAIDPAIYKRSRSEVDRSLVDIRKNLLTQSLHIAAITDVIFDDKTQKISAYVMGELAVSSGQAPGASRQAVIPYRARVVMGVATPSKINPFPFFISGLEQRFDKRALEWDAAQLRKR